jgi:hypothetical protein
MPDPTPTPTTQPEFPPNAQTEYEESELSIPVVANGEVKETLKLTGLLRMERGEPITNAAGYRQFEFTIAQWECAGYSDYLKEWVTISLSDGPQPRSVCLANQQNADYPAMIVYNAIFDVYAGKAKVSPGTTGLGVGADVEQIPPRNHVHFQKAFPLGNGVETIAGTCADMATMSAADFERRAAEFRAYRS